MKSNEDLENHWLRMSSDEDDEESMELLRGKLWASEYVDYDFDDEYEEIEIDGNTFNVLHNINGEKK